MNRVPGKNTYALQVGSSPEPEEGQGLVGVEGVLGSLGLGVGEICGGTAVIVSVVDVGSADVKVALFQLVLFQQV